METTKLPPTPESLQLAAQCWCDPETEHLVMSHELAAAFARRIDAVRAEYEPDPEVIVNEKINHHAMKLMDYFLKLKHSMTLTPEESHNVVKEVHRLMRLVVKGREKIAELPPKSKILINEPNGH